MGHTLSSGGTGRYWASSGEIPPRLDDRAAPGLSYPDRPADPSQKDGRARCIRWTGTLIRASGVPGDRTAPGFRADPDGPTGMPDLRRANPDLRAATSGYCPTA